MGSLTANGQWPMAVKNKGRLTANGQWLMAVLLLFTFHFSLFTLGFAQSSHSTMFGGGTVNIYDSYLSPYSFTGYELRIIRETSRPTKMLDGNVSVQTLLNFDGGYLDNIAGNAHEWVAGIRYSFNWHYNFRPMLDSRLKLMAGPGISGYLGGIYNTRNGNNPAQQKTDIMINLSAQASYDFTLWNKPLHARYELTVPFIGTAFSPNYGQSYYEIYSRGNYDRNMVFAWFGNKPSMQHLLTLDFPVGKSTVRVGYLGEFNQSTWNNLRYHQYSHNFLIGWVKRFQRL